MINPAKAKPLPLRRPWLLRTDARDRCPRTTAGIPAKMLRGTMDKNPRRMLATALPSSVGDRALVDGSTDAREHCGQACEAPSSGELHTGHSIDASHLVGGRRTRGD